MYFVYSIIILYYRVPMALQDTKGLLDTKEKRLSIFFKTYFNIWHLKYFTTRENAAHMYHMVWRYWSMHTVIHCLCYWILHITVHYITCVTIVFYLRENQVNQDTQAEMASQDVLLVQDLSNCRCMLTISHTIGLPRNPWSEGKNLGPWRSM